MGNRSSMLISNMISNSPFEARSGEHERTKVAKGPLLESDPSRETVTEGLVNT